MTAKEQKFCDEYLVDLNATQAAIRAGYSQKTARQIATENLSKPHISEYLQQKRSKLSEKLELDHQWVLNRFKAISDRCMTAEPVLIPDGQGGMTESGEYKFDSSGSNKATEMIGKHLGFFEQDNKQSKAEVTAPFTDDQVAKIINSFREAQTS